MKFCVLWLWMFLSEFRITFTTEINIHGYTGKGVIITCFHKWAEKNIKYFCKYPCKYGTGVLVTSEQSPKGRYTLEDFGNGSFAVNITDLQESDSGIYWCGVKRLIKDTYVEVNLTVSQDPNQTITTSTQPHEETPMDLHTTAPAAHSEAPSTTANPDALILTPSITASVHTLQHVGAGLVIAVILFVLGLVTVYQCRKRVETSESCASATPVTRNNNGRDEEDARNSTEIKSQDKTEVCESQSDSIYENISQLHEVYGNL